MYELIQLSEHDYYIDCPAKIGLVKINDTDVIAIDSGNDKDAGKKVLRILESQGWKLTAILNTHSHADHIGGNKFLQDRTGCKIYAQGMETAFVNYPLLEPMNLYGGYPHKALRHKFLMAQESHAQEIQAEELPDGLEIIPLPGHCFQMIGIRTKDDTVFLADCVSSEETLQKYGIGYLWDIGSHLHTLDTVKAMTAKRFVPSHAPVSERITDLAQINIDATLKTAQIIQNICREPQTFEAILKQIFDTYGLTMNAQQYGLIGSTLHSYLSWLLEQGKIEYVFNDNQMLWHTVTD